MNRHSVTTRPEPQAEYESELVLERKESVADSVVRLIFRHPDGQLLPPWEPGAHLDLVLTAELTRQYSLCGDPHDRSSLQVAVLREEGGRGGSRYIHDILTEGQRVTVRGPRNNFPLVAAKRYLFIAGGIGITPILPMITQVAASGRDWRLVYGGRTRSSMAFRTALEASYPGRVEIHPHDEQGLLDLPALLGNPGPDADSTAIYCCGPEALLAAVERHCVNWPAGALHVERFAPKAGADAAPRGAFEIELALTGTVLTVPADRSVLDVVEESGLPVLSSCQQGTCGTCETTVLSGTPDHRDSVLTDEERRTGDTMMICVSRSRSPGLVLDLTMGGTAVRTVPILDIDPFAEPNLIAPYPIHERLREAGPVVYLEHYRVWAMARHAEVYACLTDHEAFCSGRGAGLSDFHKEKPWRPPSLLLEADPPDHNVVRGAMGTAISASTVRGFREKFRAEAEALADELVGRGEFDAVTDLAERYPLTVFPDAVGLPAEGRENLLPYGALAFNAFGPRNHLLEQALANAAPVQEWIWASCQREALAPGGLGARLWEAADKGQITKEQAPMLVRSLLTAGVDTTVYGISNTVQALTANPGQWARLREKPSLARFAFDEALRYKSPVQTFFRTTTREVEVAGVRIPEGEKTLLFLGAANRDRRK